MFVLEDKVLGTNTLFKDLGGVFEYLNSVYVDKVLKLSENSSGGWDVKYLNDIEWLKISTLQVTKLQETENVS